MRFRPRLVLLFVAALLLSACSLPLRFCGCINDHTMEMRQGVDYVPTPYESGEF